MFFQKTIFFKYLFLTRMYSKICEDQKFLHFLHNKNRIGNKSREIKQVATKYEEDYNLF